MGWRMLTPIPPVVTVSVGWRMLTTISPVVTGAQSPHVSALPGDVACPVSQSQALTQSLAAMGGWWYLGARHSLSLGQAEVRSSSHIQPRAGRWCRWTELVTAIRSVLPLQCLQSCSLSEVRFGCAISVFSGGLGKTMEELLCNLMERKKIPYSAS